MSEFRIPSSNPSIPPSPLPLLSTVSEDQNTTQTCLPDILHTCNLESQECCDQEYYNLDSLNEKVERATRAWHKDSKHTKVERLFGAPLCRIKREKIKDISSKELEQFTFKVCYSYASYKSDAGQYSKSNEICNFLYDNLVKRKEIIDRDISSLSSNTSELTEEKRELAEKYGRIWGLLGRNYWYIGNNEESEKFLELSLKTLEEHKFEEHSLLVLSNLCVVQEDLKKCKEAEDNYRKTIENYNSLISYYKKTKKDFSKILKDLIVNLNNFSEFLFTKGSIEESTKRCEESLKLIEDLEKEDREEKLDVGIKASSLHVLVNISLMNPNTYSTAKQYAIKAKDLFETKENDPVGKAIAYEYLGIVYEKLNDLEKAQDYFSKCIELISSRQKDTKLSRDKITFFERQVKPYLHLENVVWNQKNYFEALQVADSRRSRALIQSLAEKYPLQLNLLDKNLSIQQIQQLALERKTIFIVYSLSPLINNEKKLIAWIISPKGKIQHKFLSIESIQEDIKGFEGLLKNFPFIRARGDAAPEGLELTSVEEFAEVMRGKLSREERKKQLQKEIVEQSAKIMEKERAKFSEKLSCWYKALIEPIEEFLPKDPSQTVTIVPDGFLAQLPFAAMKDSEGTYLIEKHAISIAPSIKTFQLLETIASERKNDSHGQSLIIGNPITNDPSLKQLEIGEAEAKDVGKLLKVDPEKVLLTDKATVSRFMEQASEAQWIFAACHGEANKKPELDPHSVFEGQLKLAPDEKYKEGNLHSQQISSLSLKAELVFLSACYSGTGKMQQEGVIGNVWSFLAAGALSTVATYWRLPETETTRKMVTRFYQHILGEGAPKLNKAQALREAMLLGMEKEGRDCFEKWGAFYLSGK